MILGLPVVDGHELTQVAVDHILENKVLDSTKIVIIDNGSEIPYVSNHPDVSVISNDENLGFYLPLIQLYDAHETEDYIAIMHNDLMLYEPGFDYRMAKAFEDNEKLGLIGLCGSREVDERGGRGGYTVCNFVGKDVPVGDNVWKGQDPSAGRHIEGLEPVLVLDSLFMLFRTSVIPSLMNDSDPWQDITLAHFYDRILPLRTVEAGYEVAVIGSDCDHIGGLTTTGNERYRDDCIKWLDARGIPYDNPETEMYLVAERRYLKEYRDEKRFLPAIILDGGSYEIRYLNR